MIPVKKNAANGVITVHRPFSVITLKSQECLADVKETTEAKTMFPPSTRSKRASGCSRGDETKDESPFRPKDGLQAKMEDENQEARKTTNTLLDTGFVKELERFLSQWDVAQLRRKELLHKRWTERVWLPLQRRVEDHVSCCGSAEAKRRQSLYSQYIRHCNSKGFVFLETFDPTEYNPFLTHTHCKIHGGKEQHRMAPPSKAGHKCTKKHKKQLPGRPLMESVTSRPLASSHYPASAEGKESSRLCSIPYNVLATATADGRCHKTSCWFSSCQRPPPALQRLQSLPTSK